MSKNRNEAIATLQALAIEERLAHPEQDDALVAAILEEIDRRLEERRHATRRRGQTVLAGAILGCALLAITLAVRPSDRRT